MIQKVSYSYKLTAKIGALYILIFTLFDVKQENKKCVFFNVECR